MEGLREADVRAFADVAREAAWVARAEPRRLAQWTLSAVGALVPSDSVWQLESGPAAGVRDLVRHVEADDPRIAAFRNSSQGLEAWTRLVDEYPLRRQRLLRPLETRTLLNSDYSTQTQFRRLESYDIFFRPFGLAYVATVRYRGPRGFFDLVCARRRVDFTPRELLLLELVGAVLGPAARDPPPGTRYR